jgi:hypothetical protein
MYSVAVNWFRGHGKILRLNIRKCKWSFGGIAIPQYCPVVSDRNSFLERIQRLSKRQFLVRRFHST